MTHDSQPDPIRNVSAPVPHDPPGSSLARRSIVLVLVLGLAVVVGLRVRTALSDKKALEERRDTTAKEASAKAKAPAAVKITRGARETWQPSVPFEGTLQPAAEADLAFKASGTLATLKVKSGDFVEKGALLAALDSTEAQASARAAAAQVKAAKAQHALAIDAEKRTSSMVASGAMPESSGTQAKGQLDLVSAQLEGAEAQYALASAMVRNHSLVAPFSGFVTSAPSTAGGLVAAGMPLIHVKDVSKLKLVGTVRDLDATLVKLGADVSVNVPAGVAGEKIRKAKVRTMLPAVDPATRRIPVEAEIDNTGDTPLVAGTFVRATIAGGAPLSVLRLASNTLKPGSQDEILVVKDGKLRSVRILFARTDDGVLLVRDGLSDTDDVLVLPSAEARDGDAVDVVKSEAAP